MSPAQELRVSFSRVRSLAKRRAVGLETSNHEIAEAYKTFLGLVSKTDPNYRKARVVTFSGIMYTPETLADHLEANDKVAVEVIHRWAGTL